MLCFAACFCAASPSYAIYRIQDIDTDITVGNHYDNGYPEPYYYNLYGASSSGPDENYGTISNSGAITVTFTWDNEGDPFNVPPPAVVTQEDSTAYWIGQYLSNATGSCSSGLPNETIQTGDADTPGETRTGHRYKIVQNPGSTITLTCSPTASVSFYGYDPFDTGMGSGVSYSWQIHEVRLDVGGAVKRQGNYAILIGQRALGSLVCPGTLSNFQWTVGGEKFASFDRAYDDSWGHMTPVSSNEWQKQYPHWVWKKEDTADVSVLADVAINGENLGPVFVTKQVTVLVPEYGFAPITGNPQATAGTIDGSYQLHAGGDEASPPGMKFIGSVGTPDTFRFLGTGDWTFTQLTKIATVQWAFPPADLIPILGGTHTSDYWLDAGFAFPIGGLIWPADSTKTNHTEQYAEDSPGIPVLPQIQQVAGDWDFIMYLMYKPPDSGLGSEWVPLHSFEWGFHVRAIRLLPNTAWNPNPPGWITTGASVRTTTHPHWAHIWADVP